MFERFTVKDSRIGHSNTSDLYKDDEYIGSYKSVQELMLDLALRWGADEFVGSTLWSFDPVQIPKYRGVYGRIFEPIDFPERLVIFSNSLTDIINYMNEQQDFCNTNSKYFSPQGSGIQKFDPNTNAYRFWKGGDDDLRELTDLIIEVKRSDEVSPDPVVRATRGRPEFDVFISKKSEDYPLAKELYDFLDKKGLSVFLSEESLPHIGGAEYMKEIDEALESARHLVVVGSSVENVTSSWVEAEWRVFINEIRCGNKGGNVLTMISGDLERDDLPMSLRYYEVFPFEHDSIEKVVSYVT